MPVVFHLLLEGSKLARQPKPWYRKDRKVWCVTIDGKRHNLGRNKKEAFDQFYALMQKPKERRPVAQTTMPVVVEAFLDWTHRHRAKATYEWYLERLQSFVVNHPGLAIESLKPYHVENWAASPDRSINTIRNLMRAVKRCFKWAMQQGYIASNPLAQMEIPSAVAKDVYVPPEEFEEILKFVNDEGFSNLLRVTYETGCRPQESLRLEARHLDLEHARWVIPAREAKVKSMPRIVYLTDYAANVSSELADKYPDGLLFRNSKGDKWTKSSIGCAFGRIQMKIGKSRMKELGEEVSKTSIAKCMKTLKPTRKSKGKEVAKTKAELRCEAKRKLISKRTRELGTRYSLYSLRHSWATNALKRGVDSLTVAVLMGHKDPSQLARTYQHLGHDPSHMREQAKKAVG